MVASVHHFHHTVEESALCKLLHLSMSKNQLRRAIVELGSFYGEDDTKALLVETLARLRPVITIVLEKEEKKW